MQILSKGRERLLFSLMVVGLNSVDKPMICTEIGTPNDDE